jgi:AcrR family transcriptional regulator
MKAERETRARLLAEAARLFADRGFNGVTVREICRAARANVAAINYHFGDKAGLYYEVLRPAVEAMRESTERARAAGEGRPPEERLRLTIDGFLQLAQSPGSLTLHRLIQWEMHEPTPALDMFVDEGVRPRIAHLSEIVAEMIGTRPSDRRVKRCVGSIQSQMLMVLPNPVAERLGTRGKPPAGTVHPALVRHIVAFSIAGIRAIGSTQRRRLRACE